MNNDKKRIGITGAAGHIGKTLQQGFADEYSLALYDIKKIEGCRGCSYTVVDFSCEEAVKGIFEGLDVIIHLAADRLTGASWDSVLRNNIIATRNVFEEAIQAQVNKIIFASSNHVQHGSNMKTAPDTLDTTFYEKRELIKLDDPPDPDSYYAVSKLFGENLGKLYVYKYDLQFVALRIGSTVPEDTPKMRRGKSIPEGSPAEDYSRAMFLSKRDCTEAFKKAIEVKANYLIGYAISNNTRRIFDLTETKRRLGFKPKDNAENYY